MSMRTLQNRLRDYGLKRRGINTDDRQIYQAIHHELDGPCCIRGYRAMWHWLRSEYGIQTPRSKVESILHEVDPEGTDLRKAHRLRRRTYTNTGPNFAWHVDGYDKLKPYGFPIHGCVDGFSRWVLWWKICRTNNDPSYVASFFYKCVKSSNACPRLLRTDCGTENEVMAVMQSYFRASHLGWILIGMAHHHRTSASRDGGNMVEISMRCLLFCFKDVLQTDLDSVKNHWNTHYIRKSRHDTIPGRPAELYYLPENNGFQDFKFAVTAQQLHDMGVYCEMPNEDNIWWVFQLCGRNSRSAATNKMEASIITFWEFDVCSRTEIAVDQNNVRPVLGCPWIKHSGADKL